MLDFHKLYIFLRVAQEGSFTAAAERLLPLLTAGLRDLKSTRIPEAWV